MLVNLVLSLSLSYAPNEYRPSPEFGLIQISEISGATTLPNNVIVFASDESSSLYVSKPFSDGAIPRELPLQDLTELKVPDTDDIEELAPGPNGSMYVVLSNTLNRKGENKPKRRGIVKLPQVNPVNNSPLRYRLVVDALSKPIQDSFFRTAAQGGFNIEGAALSSKGELLLGLRAPTATVNREAKPNEDAIVLRSTFVDSNATLVEHQTLNLKGQGIRGMCFDTTRRGYWILGGISPDPEDYLTSPAWSLWFCREGEDGRLEEAQEVDVRGLRQQPGLALQNAEAICIVDGPNGSRRLLILEDKKIGVEKREWSRFVIFTPPSL